MNWKWNGWWILVQPSEMDEPSEILVKSTFFWFESPSLIGVFSCVIPTYGWLALMSPPCEACRDLRAPKSHPRARLVTLQVLTSRQHGGPPTPRGPLCTLTNAPRRWLLPLCWSLLPFFFSCSKTQIHSSKNSMCWRILSRWVRESWFNFLLDFLGFLICKNFNHPLLVPEAFYQISH